MEIAGLILSGLFLFTIIYFAVRLAISPLMPKEGTSSDNLSETSLVKLRDIGIFNNEELEGVINFYEQKSNRKSLEFDKYSEVLSELKEAGYIDNNEYEDKTALLNRYFYNR